MKKTPLNESHRNLGARMGEFGGWEMPIQYPAGIVAEHTHTRTAASLFDICHMGEFRISGKDAAAGLDAILARPVISQPTGSCRYNFLLTEQGTVIDDVILYRMADDEFYLVTNAATAAEDHEQVRQLLPAGVGLVDESDATAKLDLQGPQSATVLEALGVPRDALPGYYRWIHAGVAGARCMLSRTGYTGELGFELYLPVEQAGTLWQALLDCDPVMPAGLGARDTLRLEMGYPLYGHELNRETTPLEAGFGRLLDLAGGRNFVGAEALRNTAPEKQLIGIELEGRRAVRSGSDVLQGGNIIGTVTSGSFAPSLGKAVALGYVSTEAGLKPGDSVEMNAGRKQIAGSVTQVPFYTQGTVRRDP